MHVDIQPFAEYAVAPYVGAWIETLRGRLQRAFLWSHPTWVRGLKLETITNFLIFSLSHPTWVRGLKQRYISRLCKIISVAPYVGAWIETWQWIGKSIPGEVAPYVGAWIETSR